MTDGCDDAPGSDDAAVGPEQDGEGLDELVEPSVDLRTAQEQDAASGDAGDGASDVPAGDTSVVEGGAAGSEAVDELVEPATDLRTAQEREAVSSGEDESGDVGGGDQDA